MATDQPTTETTTKRAAVFAEIHQEREGQIAAYAVATLEDDASPQIAPVDTAAQIRALCQEAIDAGEEAGFKREWLEEPERDFGGNEVDAFNAGRREGITTGRAGLAVLVLAILDPVKLCSKCSKPIADPQLAKGTAELCATCADS